MKLIASPRLWLAALLFGVALMPPALADGQKLRIGVQKYGTLIVLQVRASLEQRLIPAGVTVEWIEFPGGPQLLEALAAGRLDFGTTGEAPPVFAQAAGAPLLYVAVEPPAPAGEAILVPKDSPIRTVADLKGKRVALNKGSNVHYLLIQALDKAGLQPNDIRSVYLAPADARAAFERGSVDAWVIWDPFLAAAQDATDARRAGGWRRPGQQPPILSRIAGVCRRPCRAPAHGACRARYRRPLGGRASARGGAATGAAHRNHAGGDRCRAVAARLRRAAAHPGDSSPSSSASPTASSSRPDPDRHHGARRGRQDRTAAAGQ
ncbi:MAG: aliphatic sulfonate ABC transporter substrate-binding protein [Pseudomonadota bacterium]